MENYEKKIQTNIEEVKKVKLLHPKEQSEKNRNYFLSNLKKKNNHINNTYNTNTNTISNTDTITNYIINNNNNNNNNYNNDINNKFICYKKNDFNSMQIKDLNFDFDFECDNNSNNNNNIDHYTGRLR